MAKVGISLFVKDVEMGITFFPYIYTINGKEEITDFGVYVNGHRIGTVSPDDLKRFAKLLLEMIGD